MTVIDASAAIEVLFSRPGSERISARLSREAELHAPHLLDLEVLQALRRYALAGESSQERASRALGGFMALRIRRHSHRALLGRVWELRHNLTAPDAVYVALAEALDAPLVTRDARLAASSGHQARIELV